MDGVPQDKLNATTTRPPPIGGLNKKDPLDAMPPTDAIRLLNWIPDNGLRARKGYQEWAINFPGPRPVKTITGWFGPTTAIAAGSLDNPTSVPGKMFGVTDAGFYDITNRTNAPALSQALSGGTDAGYVSSIMMSTSGGSFLLTCSEVDGYKYFDGTTWFTPTLGAGAGQIANIDPTFFRHVNVWKRKAWFVEQTSTRLWYLPTDSITGSAAQIDVGPLLKKGGPVSYTVNWTIDAGEGIDDYLVIVSQNGEVIIYQGTDPSSATTFSLQGVYYIGETPKGRRGYCQLGGDTLLLSVNGIFPVSFITRGGSDMLSVTGNQNLVGKIGRDFSERIGSSFNLAGWQILPYYREALLLCNMPNFSVYTNRQFAMNTASQGKPWTEFFNIPAVCFGVQSSYLFSGTTDGKVLIVLQGYYDSVAYGSSIGTGIYGLIQPAFDNYGTPAQVKDFHMLRPNWYASSQPGWQVIMNVDYAQQDPPNSPVIPTATGSLWDGSLWDSAVWSGDPTTRFGDWTEVGAVGFVGSPAFVTAVVGGTLLMSIDYMIEQSPDPFA